MGFIDKIRVSHSPGVKSETQLSNERDRRNGFSV